MPNLESTYHKFSSSEYQLMIAEFRNSLLVRNLFSNYSDYTIGDLNENTPNFKSAINSTLPLLKPIGSNLGAIKTVVSRFDNTELMRVANIMYAQHMLYNTISTTSAKSLPSFDIMAGLRGIGSGGFKDIFKLPADYSITQTRDTWIGRFGGGLLDNTLSSTPFSNYQRNWRYPFNEKYDTHNDHIKALLENTGKEQLRSLMNGIEHNKYRTSISHFDTTFKTHNLDVRGDRVFTPVKYQDNSYSFEYDIKHAFDNFGTTQTNLNEFSKPEDWTKPYDSDDSLLIWSLDYDDSRYGIKGGLLEYTKRILNDSGGRIIDQTRKYFINKDNKIIGYQGSPLYKSNDSEYAKNNDTAEKTGLRQHTILSPYGKSKDKAIRFSGNKAYGGNPNSVIYKSVLPKIHPIKTDTAPTDYRNLMFSLENLAVNVIEGNGYGLIDDEWGTPIPKSEIGPSNGRLMWFPPYNLKINESTSAKYEPTVMVGRNEPMYNYMNSERNAVLSFTLLIDHPEQLRNYIGDDPNNYYKDIAEFFAFGGDKVDVTKTTKNIENRIEKLKNSIEQPTTNETFLIENEKSSFRAVWVSFPNNQPTEDNKNDIFNKMYKDGYEVSSCYDKERLYSAYETSGGTTYGYNSDVYHRDALYGFAKQRIDIKKYETEEFSQYDVKKSNAWDFITLNERLSLFKDPNVRETRKIVISAGASKLGSDNISLGNRRVEATRHLIEERLKSMGIDINSITIESIIPSKGDEGASKTGSTKDGINHKDTKYDRRADIKFELNIAVDTEEPSEKDTKITDEIAMLENELELIKKNDDNIGGHMMSEQTEPYLSKFKSITKDQYYSVFHSQTPEDFHKRLTFLQQCTRQGAAIRKDKKGRLSSRNSVFGRQPICVLRVGDFFYTKVIIENLTIDYTDSPWDLNPEGFGLQPMIAEVTLNMKVIGGQSLIGPIDALQNAVSYNYYANSTFSDKGVYRLPSMIAGLQDAYKHGIETQQANDAKEELERINKGYEI